MSTERDSHFLGFARALLNDIFDEWEGNLTLGRDLYPQDNERVAQHIARRAYDLVEHALENQPIIPHIASGIVLSNEEIIKEVPDLTEWPEQGE